MCSACSCYEKIVNCFKTEEELDDDEKVEVEDDIYESSHSSSSVSENGALNSIKGNTLTVANEKGVLVENFDVGEQEIRSDSNIGSSVYSTPLAADKHKIG